MKTGRGRGLAGAGGMAEDPARWAPVDPAGGLALARGAGFPGAVQDVLPEADVLAFAAAAGCPLTVPARPRGLAGRAGLALDLTPCARRAPGQGAPGMMNGGRHDRRHHLRQGRHAVRFPPHLGGMGRASCWMNWPPRRRGPGGASGARRRLRLRGGDFAPDSPVIGGTPVEIAEVLIPHLPGRQACPAGGADERAGRGRGAAGRGGAAAPAAGRAARARACASGW
jgi:hypothetical protein